jgi:hypothetical protein
LDDFCNGMTKARNIPGAADEPCANASQSPSVAGGSGTFIDRFDKDVAIGRAIGSHADGEVLRRGVDREKVIGIDHGALRIEPLVKPGWCRSGISYGPFRRETGLTFHTLILNGHNISRTEPIADGFRMRMWRWAVGPEVDRVRHRVRQWLAGGRRRHMWRRLRQWLRSGSGLFYWPWLEENLAVGWFPDETPDQPLRQGCGLAVHAIVPEGGELWAHVGDHSAPTVRGLQNLPFYYTVVLRDRGAAYYASSPTTAPGVGTFPRLRLLAIDAFNTDETLYAGIHQSVLGEIGFRADTRVYGAQIVKIPEMGAWYGSAHGADALTGRGPLAQTAAEVGGTWRTCEGGFARTGRGAVGQAESNLALLAPASPSGLVHMLVDCGRGPVEGVAVIWRAADEQNFWCFEVASQYGQLAIVESGRWSRHARVDGRLLLPGTANSLQVYDDGEAIRIYVNGALAYGTSLRDERLQSAAGVGIRIAKPGGNVAIRSFEAHPREITIPDLEELGRPSFALGDEIVVADEFDGPPGDLAGHSTSVGGPCWERLIGRGMIDLTGDNSARVKASADQPCPGRTAYAIDWPDPSFADLQVTVTPAGQRKGMGEKGRAGLIFWQDPENYLILSAFVEDWPAMSIAAFFRISGFEELFDAVWSNVGSRMHWGEPHDFRAVFDGHEFAAYINGEPVLYRALTDVYPDCEGFAINRVGIVANWEWGCDTGSSFRNFIGRTRS